jgi:hypothetical protein
VEEAAEEAQSTGAPLSEEDLARLGRVQRMVNLGMFNKARMPLNLLCSIQPGVLDGNRLLNDETTAGRGGTGGRTRADAGMHSDRQVLGLAPSIKNAVQTVQYSTFIVPLHAHTRFHPPPVPGRYCTTKPYFEKTVAGSTVERRDEWEAGKRATVAYLAHTRLRRGRETPCELADSRKTRLDFRVGTRDDEGVVSTQRAKK